MNEKITFPRLASLLADRSGRSKRFSEDFLREFFALISERLEAGESVKVKGIGTFRLSRVEPRKSVDVTTGQPMEISGHTKVVFVPAKELADAVNSPFEAFTAIEIADDVDISQIFANDEITLKDETEEDSNSTPDIAEPLEQEELPSLKETENTEEPQESSVPLHTDEALPPTDNEINEISSEGDTEKEELPEEEEIDEVAGRRRNWPKVVWISFGAAMVALLATLAVWYVYSTKIETTKENEETPSKVAQTVLPTSSEGTAATDSLSSSEEEPEVPTAPSDAAVYDTIGTTRYLTTMAKSHYGNYNLWPYIYEENKDFLGHPDRIRPGTPVVIPELSKYGVDPNNKDDIEKAKKLGIEIYARYGKKIY